MTTAIVLAGGASSRFGSDKLVATLDGRPLLHHALTCAAEVADHVIVVIGPDDTAPDLVGPAIIARDPKAHDGPLAGLATGLRNVEPATDVVLVLAGDMPAVRPAVLAVLRDAVAGGAAAARLEADRIQPLPMALRADRAAAEADPLLETGERSLRALFDALPTAVVPATDWRALDPDGATLRDVDTRSDLDRITGS